MQAKLSQQCRREARWNLPCYGLLRIISFTFLSRKCQIPVTYPPGWSRWSYRCFSLVRDAAPLVTSGLTAGQSNLDMARRAGVFVYSTKPIHHMQYFGRGAV